MSETEEEDRAVRTTRRAGRTGGRGSVPCRHRTGPTWSLTSLSTHPLPLPRPSARWGRRRRPPLPASAAPPRPAPPRGSRPAPCAPAPPRSQPTGRWERDGERGRVALLATRSPVGPSGRDTGPTAGPAPSGGLGPADDSSRRERVRRRRRRRRREGDGVSWRGRRWRGKRGEGEAAAAAAQRTLGSCYGLRAGCERGRAGAHGAGRSGGRW